MKTEEIVYSVTGYFNTVIATHYFKTLEEAILAVAFIRSKGYNCDSIIKLILSLSAGDSLLFKPGGSLWSELILKGPNVRVKEEMEWEIPSEVEENATC